MPSEIKQPNKRNFLIVTVIILLILNGIFIYIWNSTRTLKLEAESLLAAKEKELYQSLTELNNFKGKNAQLDSLIAVAAQELSQKSLQLDSLLSVNKITNNQLERFKRENKMLNIYKNRYLAQIDSLLQVNEKLQTENIALRSDLSEEISKRTKLQSENIKLYNKVAIGSELSISELVVSSFRVKSNGSETETTKAKNVDRIKACFTINANKVAEAGKRQLLMRIIAPDGATLFNEDSGSGKFDLGGNQTLYSTQQTANYANEALPLCINWSRIVDYKKGEYSIEIYLEGKLAGSSILSLR